MSPASGSATCAGTDMRRAFTLIEVLIATAIGMMLMALVASTLIGMRRIIERNMALTGLHENAAMINKDLARDLAASVAGAKWEMRAEPGADGWGSGDEIVTLTWMTTCDNGPQSTFQFAAGPRHDMAWCRLRWVGGGKDRPSRLFYSRSSGFRLNTWKDATTVKIHQDPLLRRDRRRELDDNDLRHLPGMTKAVWTGIAMPGDGADLDTQLALRPIHAAPIEVRDFRLSWKDEGDWTISATADAGVVQRDAAGSVVPWPGGTWDNQQCVAVDGVYLDARPAMVVGSSRSIAETRPMVVRLSCLLAEAKPNLDPEQRASLRLDLSFLSGSELPRP